MKGNKRRPLMMRKTKMTLCVCLTAGKLFMFRSGRSAWLFVFFPQEKRQGAILDQYASHFPGCVGGAWPHRHDSIFPFMICGTEEEGAEQRLERERPREREGQLWRGHQRHRVKSF